MWVTYRNKIEGWGTLKTFSNYKDLLVWLLSNFENLGTKSTQSSKFVRKNY